MKLNASNSDQLGLRAFLFAHHRESLVPAEVARALGITDKQVHAHLDCGNFVAVDISDDDQGVRRHVRVQRWSVEAWYLNQMAAQGLHMPAEESPQCAWWRKELKKPAAQRGQPNPRPN